MSTDSKLLGLIIWLPAFYSLAFDNTGHQASRMSLSFKFSIGALISSGLFFQPAQIAVAYRDPALIEVLQESQRVAAAGLIAVAELGHGQVLLLP